MLHKWPIRTFPGIDIRTLSWSKGFVVLGLLRWDAMSIRLQGTIKSDPLKESVCKIGPSRAKSVVLKHLNVSELPGEFIKTQISGPNSHRVSRLWVGPENVHF